MISRRASVPYTPPALDPDNETLSDTSSSGGEEDGLSAAISLSGEPFGPQNPAFPSNFTDGSGARSLNRFLPALDNFATRGPGSGRGSLGHESLEGNGVTGSVDSMQNTLNRQDLLALNRPLPSLAEARISSCGAKPKNFAVQRWLIGSNDPWSPLTAAQRR